MTNDELDEISDIAYDYLSINEHKAFMQQIKKLQTFRPSAQSVPSVDVCRACGRPRSEHFGQFIRCRPNEATYVPQEPQPRTEEVRELVEAAIEVADVAFDQWRELIPDDKIVGIERGQSLHGILDRARMWQNHNILAALAKLDKGDKDE